MTRKHIPLTKAQLKKLPKSAKEAKLLNTNLYFTGEPCKNGHTAERSARHRGCIICMQGHKAEYEARQSKKPARKK